mmetsp:Transcript_21995/g.72948  ORF Transcript_21995/g.72948 Transcript_21995/m.72948 type:complete len:278 (-) Transcript_21995:10-843(-)
MSGWLAADSRLDEEPDEPVLVRAPVGRHPKVAVVDTRRRHKAGAVEVRRVLADVDVRRVRRLARDDGDVRRGDHAPRQGVEPPGRHRGEREGGRLEERRPLLREGPQEGVRAHLGVLLPAQPARATEVCREEGGGRLWRRDEEVLAEEGEVRMLLSRLLFGPADHARGLDAARRLRAGGAVEKVALRKHRENDALELERLLVRGGDRRDGARQCVKSREGPSVEDSGDVLPQRVLRNRMMRGAGGDCADATHRAGSGSARRHRRSHVAARSVLQSGG